MKSLKIIERIATLNNFRIGKMDEERQNSEYEGMTFLLDDNSVRSRLAKKTPTKKGYFVVAWEKDDFNKNKPFDYENSPELLIIIIVDQPKRGLFIFPKELLVTRKILNSGKNTGKMAFRVYPTWETGLNNTAIKTQQWQQTYFIDISTEINLDKISRFLNPQ